MEEATPGLDSKSKLQIQLATVDDVRRDGATLFADHVAESEPAMVAELSPNWERYLEVEAEDQLIVIDARSRGVLIGYAVASLFRHPHYDLVVCQQDLLFVHKEWRHERVGLHLINRLRKEATARGAHHMLMHAKPDTTLGTLLPRLGFNLEELVFKETLCQQE